MNLKELAETISSSTKIDQQSVRKVLNAVFSTLKEEMAKEERVQLQGFGTFIRKPGKEPGVKARVLFKPAVPKEEREDKKEERQAKKKGEPEAT